jgi:hypothetical protein
MSPSMDPWAGEDVKAFQHYEGIHTSQLTFILRTCFGGELEFGGACSTCWDGHSRRRTHTYPHSGSQIV